MNLGLSGPTNERAADVVKALKGYEVEICEFGLMRALNGPHGSGGGMINDNAFSLER